MHEMDRDMTYDIYHIQLNPFIGLNESSMALKKPEFRVYILII